jgi:hypothetical protein
MYDASDLIYHGTLFVGHMINRAFTNFPSNTRSQSPHNLGHRSASLTSIRITIFRTPSPHSTNYSNDSSKIGRVHLLWNNVPC